METAFDKIAERYDAEFTYSAVGIRQRRRVWHYLDRVYPKGVSLDVLELNCGTGEDAIHMANMGHHVVATDVSKMMVHATEKKARRMGVEDRVIARQLSIQDLTEFDFDNKFDLIFSDFGGLNCVDKEELQRLVRVASRLLKPGGRLVGVVMPKMCAWESIYFGIKGKFKKAFRRMTKREVSVNIEGNLQSTWYHSPGTLYSIFSSEFELKRIRPIGFFLPPSYLDPFFSKHLRTLSTLEKMEKKCGSVAMLATFSDHYLIDFEVKR